MSDYMEQAECASGHRVAAYNFGRDASKPSGRHVYCNDCRRNQRNNETAEKYAQGLTATGEPYHLSESEAAIQRNREKRAEETRIAVQLKQETDSCKPEFSNESPWKGLVPVRQGSIKRRWGTW